MSMSCDALLEDCQSWSARMVDCGQWTLPAPVAGLLNICDIAIAVGLGRGANGSRRSGFSSDDGLGLGMETLGYELKLDHTHHGADDCCTQFIAWSPMIVALRLHYFGA